MALATGSAAASLQAISYGHGRPSIALGHGNRSFLSRLREQQQALPSLAKRSGKFGSAVCSIPAGSGVDLSPGEDLDVSSRQGRISFPSRFLFGAATSAFQVEGTSFGGRGECIWNTFCRKYPEKIADRSNGDIAADSYHRYKEDVDMMSDLGMDAYRFSISWPRILPNGRGKVNQEGIQYYKNLINELHDSGIEPFATLFHWDVPQALEDEYGGFLDKKIAEDFKNYARICFEEFGDKVKHWITINEPWTFATFGYGQGSHAPGRCTDGLPDLNCPAGGDSLTEPYIAGHNILLAHSEAARLYINEFQAKQQGLIGITLVSHWYEPYDNTPLEKEAQQRAIEFTLGWFMDPLQFGNYPFSMRSLVRDRLPVFTAEESEKLKGSCDFLGLNYYTTRYTQNVPTQAKLETYNDDIYANILTEKNGVPIEHAEPGSWINVYPRGLRELLIYIKERYSNPAIYITENGVLEKDEDLSLAEAIADMHRTEYLTLHLHELTEALRMESNVKGYFTWALLDNFEWQDGYTSRLGLHYIDYRDKTLKKSSEGEPVLPERTRTRKNSAVWFKRFLNIKRKAGMAFGPKI